MYSNTVTLIGLLGGDPDRRQTKNNNTFAVLSLATKASWKNKQSGEWESRTEWHRGIVFGPLADFAATLMAKLAERLLEGTLVYVQGELNTRDRQRTIKVPNGNALIEAVVKQPEVEVEADLIRILDRRRSQPRLSDRSGQSDSKDTRVEFSRMEVNRLVAKRKVYISSTYVDLKRHREALSQALRRMGYEDVSL